jgi:hypothetical protein
MVAGVASGGAPAPGIASAAEVGAGASLPSDGLAWEALVRWLDGGSVAW